MFFLNCLEHILDRIENWFYTPSKKELVRTIEQLEDFNLQMIQESRNNILKLGEAWEMYEEAEKELSILKEDYRRLEEECAELRTNLPRDEA